MSLPPRKYPWEGQCPPPCRAHRWAQTPAPTISITPAPSKGAAPLRRRCRDGSDGWLCSVSGPSREVGGQAPSPAFLSFPSHAFPSSLPSCVPHFLAFYAAWESSRIFSAVAQPTSEGKGWMTKPNPSSKPTVSRRAAGSWATPVPHPSSLLPPSASTQQVLAHSSGVQDARDEIFRLPAGGIYLDGGQRRQRCQWKLCWGRGARWQRRHRRPEAARSAPGAAQRPFLFGAERGRRFLRPGCLEGGQHRGSRPAGSPSPPLSPKRSRNTAKEPLRNKPQAPDVCGFRAPSGASPLPRRPGLPKKPSSRRSHFAASCSCYCLLTANEGPWGISSVLEG